MTVPPVGAAPSDLPQLGLLFVFEVEACLQPIVPDG